MSANSRVKCVPLITTGSSQKHGASGRAGVDAGAGAILMMYNEGTSLCPCEGLCAFHIKRLKEITFLSTEQRARYLTQAMCSTDFIFMTCSFLFLNTYFHTSLGS